MGLCVKCKKPLGVSTDHLCHDCYIEFVNRQAESLAEDSSSTNIEEPGLESENLVGGTDESPGDLGTVQLVAT